MHTAAIVLGTVMGAPMLLFIVTEMVTYYVALARDAGVYYHDMEREER